MKNICLIAIGCDYTNSNIELKGCINDCIDISQSFLGLCQKNKNFNLDIQLLTDNNHKKFPSKKTIMNILSSKINLCNKNKIDNLIFYFAGHGVQIKDTNNDELDGLDETILTGDRQYLKDDEFRNLLSTLKNNKSNALFIFDCCHSGSILDLPKVVIGNNSDKTFNQKNQKIISICACDDSQTSKETNGRGIFTKNFCNLIRNYKSHNLLYPLLDSLNNIILGKHVNMNITVSCCKNVNYKKSTLFRIPLLHKNKNNRTRSIRFQRNNQKNKNLPKKKCNKQIFKEITNTSLKCSKCTKC